MLRKLALSLAIAGVLGIPNANALGLGEINIRSALNEPLEAEIRLLQVRDLSPMQIQPRMADVDDFSLAGVTRSRFISDVRFQVNVFPDGTGIIRMTSSEPIREPFLNFLVEVNWPSGRLVREYTLLLDPPVFDPAPVSRPVQPAVSSAPMPAVVVPSPVQSPPVPAPAPAPVAAAPAVAAPSNLQSRADAQTQIYVDVRDTMWELALKHRPDSSITPQQMMLALQRRNPGSFPTGNVNMLKAGTVMDIPSSSEIRALSAQQANAEFARQTELWRQGRAAPRQEVAAAPAVDGSREEGKPEAQSEAVTEEVPSELKIVTPPAQEETATEERAVSTEQSAPDVIDPGEQSVADAEAPAEMTEQVEVQEQRIEQIDTRLMMTEETIDMQRRDIQELQSNFNELLELFQQQSRLLELKDQQIAELQAQLAAREAPPPAASGGGFMESVERFINSVSSIPYIGPILGGILALLLALLFIRKRKSSSKEDDPGLIRAPKDLDAGDTAAKVAPVAAVAATAAAAQEEPEESPAQEEERIVHQPLSAAADSADDLSDLDLDMDLDIPETPDVAETAEEEVRVLDEEFDLSADDFDDLDELDLSSPDAVNEEVASAESETAIEESGEDSNEEDLISGLGLEDKDDLEDLEFTGGDTADADLDDEEPLSDDVDSLFDLDFDEDDSATADAEDEFEAIELSDDELSDDELSDSELSDENEMPDLGTAAAATAAAGALAADDDSDDEFDSDLEGLLAGMDDEDAESLQETSEDDADSAPESTAETETDSLSLDEDFDLDDLENELDQELDAEPDTLEEDEALPASGAMQLDDVGSDLTDSKDTEETDTEDDFLTAFEFDDIEDQDEASLAVSEALSNETEVPDADDIDSLLSSLSIEDDEPVQRKPRPGEVVEDELTANIAHDLELELDSELDDLLNSTDDEIAIEETDASDTGSDDILEGLGLLDGADENETKLDLARAYIEMDDVEGARDILGEILREGNDQQREEAEELLKSLS